MSRILSAVSTFGKSHALSSAFRSTIYANGVLLRRHACARCGLPAHPLGEATAGRDTTGAIWAAHVCLGCLPHVEQARSAAAAALEIEGGRRAA